LDAPTGIPEKKKTFTKVAMRREVSRGVFEDV